MPIERKIFMKKITATLFAILLAVGLASAQNPLPKGRTQINAGVGLAEKSIPVYVGLDHGIGNDFSLGLETSYRDKKDYYNVWGFSGNFNYHFNRVLNIPSTFDVYAGLNVGAYLYNYYDSYHDNDMSSVGLGLQIGGRYYITPNFAINLEIGGGNAFSGGKFGVSFKL